MAVSMEGLEAGLLTRKEINEGLEQVRDLIGNFVGTWTKTMDDTDMNDSESLKLMVQSIQVCYKALNLYEHTLNTLTEIDNRTSKMEDKEKEIIDRLDDLDNKILAIRFKDKDLCKEV